MPACGGLQRITTRSSFEHPRAIAVVAACTFLVSAVVAWRDTPPRWELDITVWIERRTAMGRRSRSIRSCSLGHCWPRFWSRAFILLYRDWLLAVATIAVGVVAWFGAKGIKRVIERGRPLDSLPNIDVREGEGTGLGFVSGHSAVAAASAVMLIGSPSPAPASHRRGDRRARRHCENRFRLHLPADVVGGWSFGVLLALGALWIVDAIERARGPVARGAEE